MTIMFVYKADLYCQECGSKIRQALDLEGKAPADPNDEYSYDSDDYPKEVIVEQCETDTPNHCADCGEYIAQPLTMDGLSYVIECLRQYLTNPTHPGNSEALDAWADDLANYVLESDEHVILDLYREKRDNENQR